MTISMKPWSIGLNPLAHQRPLNGAEARMVRTLAACLKPRAHPPGTAPGDRLQNNPPSSCKPHPRHCHTSKPHPRDSCHPSGSLKTDKDGKVTTPGGYKIEVCGPCEWKITGPDCKTTRVWGDPHVDEGDGGKWDFKRDSTFMLGDGTRINVTTKPAGPNVTITQGLEIISGNDRVQFPHVDTGQKTPSPVTHDGYQHANSFGNKDVFVMGRETDDWSFKGREVIGSNNNGETFKLGTPGILPGEPNPAGSASAQDFNQQLTQLLQQLAALFERLQPASGAMEKCHLGSGHLQAPGTEGSWMKRRQEHLHQGFNDIGRMVTLATQMRELLKGGPNLHRPFTA
jgi:hypothetical protein